MIDGIERGAKVQEYKTSAASSRSFVISSVAVSVLWACLYAD